VELENKSQIKGSTHTNPNRLLWRSAAATATLNRLESWFEQWTERNKNDAAE